MTSSETDLMTPETPARERSSLAERSGRALRSIEDALHLPHHRRVGPTRPLGEMATPDEARAAVLELRTELVEERREVLEPLLRRMAQFAERLERRDPVPPSVVREGLDLWTVYVERLHDVHVGQFTTARSAVPHEDPCTLPLVQLSGDPEQADRRIREVRSVLVNYEANPRSGAGLLAAVLGGCVSSELAWEHFEEDLTRSCLPDHLTVPALRQWATALVETHATAEATRAKVTDFLRRTEELSTPDTEPVTA